jgi:hypothetical protein
MVRDMRGMRGKGVLLDALCIDRDPREWMVESRGIPHLAKIPDFLSSPATVANCLRLSLRESRTRVHNGGCVVGNPGSERDVGHPSVHLNGEIFLRRSLANVGIDNSASQ